mmetsp:Transcript_36716/g.67988  ORF Transcript_36716/g.67988 Transcript_36716/m.67988 type:complete len:119 (-) Transcript_36716:154-510(-)
MKRYAGSCLRAPTAEAGTHQSEPTMRKLDVHNLGCRRERDPTDQCLRTTRTSLVEPSVVHGCGKWTPVHETRHLQAGIHPQPAMAGFQNGEAAAKTIRHKRRAGTKPTQHRSTASTAR